MKNLCVCLEFWGLSGIKGLQENATKTLKHKEFTNNFIK
jgi:hypothetical protein